MVARTLEEVLRTYLWKTRSEVLFASFDKREPDFKGE